MYQITRHLAVQPDALQPEGVLAQNLYFGTRLLAGDELWDLLKRYSTPAEVSSEPLFERAVGAELLCACERRASLNRFLENVALACERVLKERLGWTGRRLREELGDLDRDGLAARLDRTRGLVLERLGGARGPELRHYLWDDPTRLGAAVFDHLAVYLREELDQPLTGAFDPGLARRSLRRPRVREEYEQQPCTLFTTCRRIAAIAEAHPPPARVLVLGEDDLVGLGLGLRGGYEVDVFEIDEELLAFLAADLPAGVRLFSRDLTQGLPKEHHRLYDVVVTDPMYAGAGMRMFQTCCRQGLSEDPGARVYLSTCPDLLEDAEGFFAGLEAEGLEVVTRERNFNRYPFPQLARRATFQGLTRLGGSAFLFACLLEIPYLYADLFVLQRK